MLVIFSLVFFFGVVGAIFLCNFIVCKMIHDTTLKSNDVVSTFAQNSLYRKWVRYSLLIPPVGILYAFVLALMWVFHDSTKKFRNQFKKYITNSNESID
jgi:putative flippase GtrA